MYWLTLLTSAWLITSEHNLSCFPCCLRDKIRIIGRIMRMKSYCRGHRCIYRPRERGRELLCLKLRTRVFTLLILGRVCSGFQFQASSHVLIILEALGETRVVKGVLLGTLKKTNPLLRNSSVWSVEMYLQSEVLMRWNCIGEMILEKIVYLFFKLP